MKELAEEMEQRTGKKYSLQSLSHRLTRGTITYNEVLLMAEILGYHIKFENS